MKPKYKVGQKVVIKPIEDPSKSGRDSGLGRLVGQEGTVAKYYWIRPNTGKIFYIYTVRFGEKQKEIVLHEDEMEAAI